MSGSIASVRMSSYMQVYHALIGSYRLLLFPYIKANYIHSYSKDKISVPSQASFCLYTHLDGEEKEKQAKWISEEFYS